MSDTLVECVECGVPVRPLPRAIGKGKGSGICIRCRMRRNTQELREVLQYYQRRRNRYKENNND